MAYVSPDWANGSAPAINAQNLQALSDAVEGMIAVPQKTAAEVRTALGLGSSTGALTIANGGTGATTAADARSNLGITAANLGALPLSGGTITGNLTVNGTLTASVSGSISGNAATATRLAASRSLKVNLGSTSAQSFDGSADATSIGVSGTLPVANGGTGQTNGANALKSFLAAGPTILSSNQYGNSLPSSGTYGQIFFKKA